MGVGHVAHASRAADARRMLEGRTFDVVLCDYHFDHSPMSGQDLLDDLRRSQLLPYSTVFVMVTGEAGYTQVAEAAEAALDSYLLKPHTASALGSACCRRATARRCSARSSRRSTERLRDGRPAVPGTLRAARRILAVCRPRRRRAAGCG